MTVEQVYPVKIRMLIGALCIVFALLVLAGAVSIPFFYPSSSLFYKFGANKLLLRSGKMVGLTAAVLLCFQALLISRLKILERIFPAVRILIQHRTNGLVIGGLVLLHPILIVGAENFTFFTLEKRYWPEFVGVGLLTASLILIVTAQWRSFFKLGYQQWRIMHGIGGFLLLILLAVHVLFVSESFAGGPPRFFVFLAAGLNFLFFLRIWYQKLLQKRILLFKT